MLRFLSLSQSFCITFVALIVSMLGPAKAVLAAEPPGYTSPLSTGVRLDPVGEAIDLGSVPLGMAIAPEGNKVAVILSGWREQGVQIVDLKSRQVTQTLEQPAAFLGITFSRDGKHLFVSGGNDDSVFVYLWENGAAKFERKIVLGLQKADKTGSRYPAGLAVSSRGDFLYVAENVGDSLAVVNPGSGEVVQRLRTDHYPYGIEVAADGKVYVSAWGADTVLIFKTRKDGRLKGSGKVTVGRHPSAMASNKSGSRLFVALAGSDETAVVDTKIKRVVQRLSDAAPAGPSEGSTPNAMALSDDGSKLFVAEADNNAIAVFEVSEATTSAKTAPAGRIPTDWYPTGVLSSARQLLVLTGKGHGSHANPDGPIPAEPLTRRTGYDLGQLNGTLRALPNEFSAADLTQYSERVSDANNWGEQRKAKSYPPFKHVIYIIKENRTYDQLFGDVTTANGDASIAVFAPYTPNQHAFLQRFATLDNVYAPSRQSADGHPWIVAGISAYADESQSPDWIRSYPGGNGYDSMIVTQHGYLWDAAIAKGLSVKLYGEWSGSQSINGNYSWSDWYAYSQYLEGKTPTNPTTITPTTDTESSTEPSASAILDPHYPSFNTGIPDQYRVDYWLPIFQNQEKTGTLPALTIIWLPDDHTSGFSTGFPIPTAAQADNDLGLGRIVQAITKSPDWATSAIFVEEDDAQDGVDHVDGHRQPVQIISPYAVQSNGAGDHSIYTSASIDRTIEQILGLTPMTEFDLVASPMRTAFVNTPVNIAPYTALAPTIALNTFPTASADSKSATGKLKAAWNQASNEIFKAKFDKADAVDETFLNHVIWYSTTGFTRPYPGEKTVLMPSDLKAAGRSEEIED